ncbi:MAG: KOW motif-containing protein [Myxococcales bacterium]|nr:KOW motif-containing protein [Myxococcales bacterium]
MTFPGFSGADFDAYQPQKWQSRVFNLERLQVKQKLSQLGRTFAPEMLASDGSLLELELSNESPALWNQHKVECQYLFFSRNAAARAELDGINSRGRSMASLIEDPSPLRQHVFLGVRIDCDQVEIGLKLHSNAAVDRENLVRKLADHNQRERLAARLAELPAGFTIGLTGHDEVSVAGIDGAALTQLAADLGEADSWLSVHTTFSRDDAQLAEAQFAERVAELMRALLPVMHEIAWSRDNDCLSMSETLRENKAKKKQKGLQKNDRVRVLAGLFAGKVGVVQSIDPKGGLKVMLGSMPVKLSSDEVQKV